MAEDWVEKTLQLYRFDFDEADTDKSGTLSFKEINKILIKQGFNGSFAEAGRIFRHLDAYKDRAINRDEFTDAMRALPKMTLREFALRKTFKDLDKDGNGYLTMKEVWAATKEKNDHMGVSDTTVYDLLLALVTDEDQKLNYDEFLCAYRNKQEIDLMRTLFTKLDADGNGTLSRKECYEVFKSDYELSVSMDKITDLLSEMAKTDDQPIDYNQFLKVWSERK